MLNIPILGAINVHPYLYKYKGGNPVGKALSESNFKASVGVHKMTEMLDEGEVIVEQFLDTTGSKSVEEIYNKLYPCYVNALLKALEIVGESKRKFLDSCGP